jgi:phosphorylase kinase alpha/beta subunit
MRGILECWIKQAPRIELFKKNQCNKHALHCKFHLTTGAEVYDDEEYYHLQVMCQFLVHYLENFIQVLYRQFAPKKVHTVGFKIFVTLLYFTK